MSATPLIDIIIPVYKGLEETRQCIQSVLSADLSRCGQVIVINDASPDEKIVDYCNSLSEKVVVLHNNKNMGFVASVNKGMKVNQRNDVILLNSDCRVSNDWVARLSQCVYSDEKAATATPFSNNGTICSYPIFNFSYKIPEDVSLEKLDNIFRKVNKGKKQQIPTAVGFCMYIKRSCLDEVGLFDETLFGIGYGEENEFSLRSARKGWRHYLCADTFVYHHGSISFGGMKHSQMEKAEKILMELYPEYNEMVNSFIVNDPLRAYRDAVDDLRIGALDSCKNIISEQKVYRDALLKSMKEYSKMIVTMKREIDSYRHYLDNARREYAELNDSLLKVEGLAKENFEKSQNLEKKLESHIHKYEKVIADKNFQLEKMNEDFHREKFELIRNHEIASEKAMQVIAGLEESLKERQAHINEMINSRSWRYTKWLRWLSRKMVK